MYEVQYMSWLYDRKVKSLTHFFFKASLVGAVICHAKPSANCYKKFNEKN